jgi:trans-aconitate methyltransferase
MDYTRIDFPDGTYTAGPSHESTFRHIFADFQDTAWSLLDLGCALGAAGIAAGRFGAIKICNVEHLPARLEQARINWSRANFACCASRFELCDVEQFQPDEPYDVVLLLNVLHHLQKPLELTQKSIGWTRRRLAIEVPARWSLGSLSSVKQLCEKQFTRQRIVKRIWKARSLLLFDK